MRQDVVQQEEPGTMARNSVIGFVLLFICNNDQVAGRPVYVSETI